MELLFSRPVIRGTINGEGPVAVLIDPQLQTTALPCSRGSPQAETDTRPQRDYTVVRRVRVWRHKLPKVPVEVRDTGESFLNSAPASQPAVVLSPSAWGDQLVTLDYADSKCGSSRAHCLNLMDETSMH